MEDLDEYIEELINKIVKIENEQNLDFDRSFKMVETAIKLKQLERIIKKLDYIGDVIEQI